MLKFLTIEPDGAICDNQHPLHCSFGILEVGALLTSALVSAGVGATTAGIIGTVGAGALTGAGLGAATSAITGKDPLKGAEFGAISGGTVAGLGPVIEGATGFGAIGSDALAGAAGGALGSVATGQNPLTGAVTGGIGGAVTGAFSGSGAAPSSTSPPTGGPVGSAASTAAPASVSIGSTGGDVTAGVNSGGVGDVPAGSTGISYSGGAAPPTIGTSLSAGAPAGAIGGGVSTPDIPASAISSTNPVQVTGADVPSFGANPGGSISTATPSLPSPSIGSQIGSFVKDNSWLLPAGALGLAAMESQKSLPGQAQLEASAQNLTNQSHTLENYLQTGTLPPGVQQGIDRASAAAKASVRSEYASTIGGGTSSAEQQDIAAVNERAAVEGANIATSLLQQGISEQGMADNLYTTLMNNALQQDQALGDALGAFAGAMVPSLLKAA